MLLDAGVPLRHPRWDITALTTAAYNGHKELVDLFLGRGATVAERESALTLEPRPTSERGNYIASDRDWPREEAHNLGGLLETLAKSGNPEAISLARQLLTPKSSHTYFLRRAEGVGDSALSSAVRGNQFALATHLLDRGAPTDLNVVVRDPIFPVLQILSRSEQSRILRTRNVSVNMKFAGEDGYFRKHGIRVETNVPGTVPHVTQSLEDLLAAAKDPRFVAILRR
jgi:ankyrin repeat protein